MLRDRHYVIDNEDVELTLEQFREKYEGKSLSSLCFVLPLFGLFILRKCVI